MATRPFERWSADQAFLIIGPGVESAAFKLDDPVTDLTATQILALQTGTNKFVVVPGGGGSGDVTGPGSSTDNAVALFSGTTGTVLQNSVVTIDGAGNVAGVTSINGSAVPSPLGDVSGPGSSTDTALARYSGTTGKLIEDSVVTLDNAGNIAGVLGMIFQNPLITHAPYFSWNYRSGVVAPSEIAGPWATPPPLPWFVERNGNTVTFSFGPMIALNDGDFGAMAFDFDFSGSLSGFQPAFGTWQNGTLLIMDGGVAKFVQWSLTGGGGFVFIVSDSLSSAPPSGPIIGFNGGSTGLTGFANMVTVTWLIVT